MDRIIHIIKKLSSEKFPEKMVDDAVCYYESNNMTQTRDYLVKEKTIAPATAAELVNKINEEWIKVHQGWLTIQAIVMTVFLFIFVGGLYLVAWYLIFMGFIFGVLRIFSVVSLVSEINKRKRDFLLYDQS